MPPEGLRPFGADSRLELLSEYFAEVDVAAENAWQHIYRLLLWVDRTIGLARCYESDKAQPGRPWYRRTLQFHVWLAEQFGVGSEDLADELDWLFKRVTERFAEAEVARRSQLLLASAEQRAEYSAHLVPEPGREPELSSLIEDEIGADLIDEVSMDRLVRKIRAYFAAENNRSNLTGEGFEDAVAEIAKRIPELDTAEIYLRPVLHQLPGFREPPGMEKPRKVDMAIISPARRVLVSCKWSIRADREEQFYADWDSYSRMESAGEPFDFVLVTNEFDAARLRAATTMRRANQKLFATVVHVNPAAVEVVHREQPRGAAVDTLALIETGVIKSLRDWLTALPS